MVRDRCLKRLSALSTDPRGHTIVYRQLHAFQPADLTASTMPAVPAGTAPKWLADYDAEHLITLLAAIRQHAEPRLVAVPEALRETHRSLLLDAKFGICRVLQRHRFQAIVASRGGAAYFDFISQSHDYNEGAHLGLDGNRFLSGFAGGDLGYIVDLGTWPLLQADCLPSDADDYLRQAMPFVRDVRAVRETDGSFAVAAKDMERAAELGVDGGAAAVAGHTYLLRAVHSTHAITVAFHVLALDGDAATLLWRIVACDGR